MERVCGRSWFLEYGTTRSVFCTPSSRNCSKSRGSASSGCIMYSRKLETAVVIIAHKHLSIWSCPLSSKFYHLVSIYMFFALISSICSDKVEHLLMHTHNDARRHRHPAQSKHASTPEARNTLAVQHIPSRHQQSISLRTLPPRLYNIQRLRHANRHHSRRGSQDKCVLHGS